MWYIVVLLSAFWIGLGINWGMNAIGKGLCEIAKAMTIKENTYDKQETYIQSRN